MSMSSVTSSAILFPVSPLKPTKSNWRGLLRLTAYFKVLTDGSIETRNANISGTVKASGVRSAALPSIPAVCIGRAAIISETIPGV